MSTGKLVVFGATGQQGHSILTTILAHPTLSTRYSLRGITRDASKPKPQFLAAQGVEMIEANLDDRSTLPATVQDAHTVILITETQYVTDLKERETAQAKAVADAALAAGVQFFIFSTAVHTSKLWDGGPVDQFDVKAEIEAYIRSLPFPLGSAHIAPAMFMQNLGTVMRPRKQGDGSWAIVGINDPHTKIPLIDAAGDSGAYLVPVLLDPRSHNGAVIYAASGLYSYAEIAGIMAKASGETVKYVQIPKSVFQGFMEEERGPRIVAMMSFIDNPGYYGAGTGEKVAETVELVGRSGGKLASFEEFAEKNFKAL
ncbi:uncharacterized protein BDV17DRAFT_301264 [Aspergillus undulatus]|uniref:uncharacterized protein n=1 Tax=Aspergillus undulatus TaxID=1810928 RepID=UPI003CCD4743